MYQNYLIGVINLILFNSLLKIKRKMNITYFSKLLKIGYLTNSITLKKIYIYVQNGSNKYCHKLEIFSCVLARSFIS